MDNFPMNLLEYVMEKLLIEFLEELFDFKISIRETSGRIPEEICKTTEVFLEELPEKLLEQYEHEHEQKLLEQFCEKLLKEFS